MGLRAFYGAFDLGRVFSYGSDLSCIYEQCRGGIFGRAFLACGTVDLLFGDRRDGIPFEFPWMEELFGCLHHSVFSFLPLDRRQYGKLAGDSRIRADR